MNHQHILWDPRGGTFGKACLFGAELGLDEVHESIDFQMPPAAILSWALKSSIDLTQIQYPLLSIHIHCNSRVTSNWPLSHALNLAHLWHKNTGGSVIFLGDPKRFQFFARWAYYQSFPCDWASTGAIILASSLFVGVDSGPMHLARAAKLNQVFIWGGSGPRDILGRQPQWNDAIGKVPCVDQICCSCPQGRPRCIDETTAADIWKIIESGTFKKWTLTPFPG
jgi:ADP-heptose:LPS heptosyltransferase